MKVVRLAIFLTGISGLAMGGIMTLSSLRSAQEETRLHANDTLKSLATEYVDQFFGMLEAAKNSNGSAGTAPSYVTERAVVKLSKGLPSEFESFASTDLTLPVNQTPLDFALEERILAGLKSSFSFSDFQIARIELGTYSLTDNGSKEGIFIATPIYKLTNGVTDPNTIEKISLSLVDPVKAFANLQKISANSESVSAYLLSKRGRVLAHSMPAFVGTDLMHIESLKTTLENLFIGAQTGSVGRYTNVDGVSEQVAFVRAGTSPFAFGVEMRATPAVLSRAWLDDQVESGAARRNLGLLFIAIALMLFAMTVISGIATRKLNQEILNSREHRAGSSATSQDVPHSFFSPRNSPDSFAIAPPAKANANPELPMRASLSVTSRAASPADTVPNATDLSYSTTNLVHARDQIALEREQMAQAAQGLSSSSDVVRDFVDKIEKCYTLEGVEKELVEISSEIADSPVLYFRYHRRNQTLTLSSFAGEVNLQNYSNMHAYVRKDIELQVEQMASDGKVASISNYGPMSKLMITHLNVAHFEAWAVTSHPEVSKQSKWVGVVVVLQAGVRSAQARPLLARLLKEAGNYLYAQSNKIRIRSAEPQGFDLS